MKHIHGSISDWVEMHIKHKVYVMIGLRGDNSRHYNEIVEIMVITTIIMEITAIIMEITAIIMEITAISWK